MLENRAAVRRGRLGIEALLHRPGQAILVAVVASPEGRWAAELNAPNPEARAARELLLQVFNTRKPRSGQPMTVRGSSALLLW